MSKTCQVCGRGPVRSQQKSHSQIKTKRWQNVNLQNKKVEGKAVKMCTKCLKTLKKA